MDCRSAPALEWLACRFLPPHPASRQAAARHLPLAPKRKHRLPHMPCTHNLLPHMHNTTSSQQMPSPTAPTHSHPMIPITYYFIPVLGHGSFGYTEGVDALRSTRGDVCICFVLAFCLRADPHAPAAMPAILALHLPSLPTYLSPLVLTTLRRCYTCSSGHMQQTPLTASIRSLALDVACDCV